MYFIFYARTKNNKKRENYENILEETGSNPKWPELIDGIFLFDSLKTYACVSSKRLMFLIIIIVGSFN